MKLKFILVCICITIQFSAYNCKPMPGSTKEITTTEAPVEGKTPPPWLKFLKNKKTTANPLTSTESSALLPLPVKGSSGGGKGKGVKSERAVDTIGAPPTRSPTPSEMEELANWLGIYLQPSGDILAQDRQQNPDSLYDEIYLDWMKRDLASQPQSGDVASNVPATGGYEPQPAPQPMFGYPTMPMSPYGYMAPFFAPLAGIKMNKIMVQAQMDAALAALNITTTPKPYKLKLKITVPGNANATQLSQITTGISNSLPVGSTFELA